MTWFGVGIKRALGLMDASTTPESISETKVRFNYPVPCLERELHQLQFIFVQAFGGSSSSVIFELFTKVELINVRFERVIRSWIRAIAVSIVPTENGLRTLSSSFSW